MSDVHKIRIQRIESMLLEQPNDPFLHFALAKELDSTSDLPKACSSYLKVLELDSNYIGAYYHLAELQYRMGKVEDASKTAQKGIEVATSLRAQKDIAELYQLLESF